MSVTGFGKLLFTSGDLDPVYLALNGSKMEDDQLARWLVAYWSFYHCGLACWASERRGKAFWAALLEAARNETEAPCRGRWPRGTERRHFRGAAGLSAVEALRKRYGSTPEDMVEFMADGPLDVRSVIDRASTHRLFGSWIGFKIADMLDAVVGLKVKQDDVSVFLYDTPRKSILEKLPLLPIKQKGTEEELLERAMHWLRDELEDHPIPHKPKSKPDWFSLETVWCKHLSHMHGHYPPFKDIHEIRHGLQPWLKSSPTAIKFLGAMPVAPTYVIQGRFF